jgi:hypothetical protein
MLAQLAFPLGKMNALKVVNNIIFTAQKRFQQ